jgi:hypothetical protein
VIPNHKFKTKNELSKAIKPDFNTGKMPVQAYLHWFGEWCKVVHVGEYSIRFKPPTGNDFFEKWPDIQDQTFCVLGKL